MQMSDQKIPAPAKMTSKGLGMRISELEGQIAPALAELKKLKRQRAALAGAQASANTRRQNTQDQSQKIYARWKSFGVTRGVIPLLAEEFGLGERTILRRLEQAGREEDRASARERQLDNMEARWRSAKRS